LGAIYIASSIALVQIRGTDRPEGISSGWETIFRQHPVLSATSAYRALPTLFLGELGRYGRCCRHRRRRIAGIAVLRGKVDRTALCRLSRLYLSYVCAGRFMTSIDTLLPAGFLALSSGCRGYRLAFPAGWSFATVFCRESELLSPSTLQWHTLRRFEYHVWTQRCRPPSLGILSIAALAAHRRTAATLSSSWAVVSNFLPRARQLLRFGVLASASLIVSDRKLQLLQSVTLLMCVFSIRRRSAAPLISRWAGRARRVMRRSPSRTNRCLASALASSWFLWAEPIWQRFRVQTPVLAP